jgi:predicted transport protein
LAGCCSYKVTEKKYYLFEKELSEFQFERNLYFRKEDIKIQTDTLKMHLILKYYDVKDDQYFAKDTTIYTLLK